MCNRRGQAFHPDDLELVVAEQRLMKQPPFVLDEAGRAVVGQAIRDHCEVRGWGIHALNVRTNHVHVVVACQPRYRPERVVAEFKSWGTRRLRAGGLIDADRRVWTDHGSTRWINTEEGLFEAYDYVMNRQ